MGSWHPELALILSCIAPAYANRETFSVEWFYRPDLNIVPRVSHLTASGGGKMRDPGNEVDPTSLGNTDIAWQILHHQFWSILGFPIDGFYVYHPSQKSINGDRFRDTSCRFCSHELREGKFSISSRWHGPSNRQTNPRSVQHCWVCLPEESWNLTRKGALASVSVLLRFRLKVNLRIWCIG